MEKKILKINDPEDDFNLPIKNVIHKKKKNFSKSINLILKLLIESLLLIFIFFISLFYKIKLQLKVLLKDILKRNGNKENINIVTSNLLNINNSLPIFLENKLKDLLNPSIEWPLPNKIKFKPYSMPTEELIAFLSFMKPNLTYFEFGSGGSTNVASYYKLNVYSVESDKLWHNKLKESNINATYLTIDLKTEVNGWGFPGKNTSVEDWKKYFQAYQSKYNADIIFIDGRFRVICGLDIFQKIRNDTLVLIHDYNNRKIYHILEKYYIKVGMWGSLYAFFKNPNITSIPQNVYNKYMYEKM